MEGTNPLTMSEWLMDSSLPLGGNLDLEDTKLLLDVLKLHSGQWLIQHISYLFVPRNILELHCSFLHHIHDIVIFDLDMLRLVMEHWVLRKFHTTLVVAIYTSSIQLEILDPICLKIFCLLALRIDFVWSFSPLHSSKAQ